MLHSTNKINYKIAQRVADITQKTTELIIETQKDIEEKYSQSNNDDSEFYTAKKKVFKRYFYPRKNSITDQEFINKYGI